MESHRSHRSDSIFDVWLLTAFKSYDSPFLSSLHLGKLIRKSECYLFGAIENKSSSKPHLLIKIKFQIQPHYCFLRVNLIVCSSVPRKFHYVGNKHFTLFWYVCGIISLDIQTKLGGEQGSILPLQGVNNMNKWGRTGYFVGGSGRTGEWSSIWGYWVRGT